MTRDELLAMKAEGNSPRCYPHTLPGVPLGEIEEPTSAVSEEVSDG